jgi:hypothetical protein
VPIFITKVSGEAAEMYLVVLRRVKKIIDEGGYTETKECSLL